MLCTGTASEEAVVVSATQREEGYACSDVSHKCACFVAGASELSAITGALDERGAEPSIRGCGPAKAVTVLCKVIPNADDRTSWAVTARVEAIVGSCPRSLESAKSGMRAWIAFVREVLGRSGDVFPPLLDDLLAWSRLFQHEGTFRNYLTYVRLGCEIVGKSVAVFDHVSLRRAKVAVAKRNLAVRRKPRFIHQETLAAMVLLSLDVPSRREFVMLCLISYIFLLRVPSECLPVAVHSAPETAAACTVVRLNGDELEMHFPRRKNRNEPTVATRKCWCDQCANTCPVHVVGDFLSEFSPGEQPFLAWKPHMVLRELRAVLAELGMEEASAYVAHDLRRGHADDILRRGGTLIEILRAGDWRSASFLTYLNKHRLERDATMAAHIVDSSDEE